MIKTEVIEQMLFYCLKHIYLTHIYLTHIYLAYIYLAHIYLSQNSSMDNLA